MVLRTLYTYLHQMLDDEARQLKHHKIVRKASSSSQLLDQKAIFVVSSGRSGTKNLTLFLARHTDFIALHAPKPWLATTGYQFHAGLISNKQASAAFYASREEYLKAAYERKKILFDGDCKNLPLTIEIGKVMPNAKFIHLVRNPFDFIKSGLARGYYSSLPPELMGHLESSNSEDMSQLEKIAWFWNEANQIAEQGKLELGSDRLRTISAEELFESPIQLIETLRDFGFSENITSQTFKTVEKVNAQQNKEALVNTTEAQISSAILKYAPTWKNYYPNLMSQIGSSND